MDADLIQRALADITSEQDPTLKSAKMASLCSALFRERGIDLVVVGGSGIELLTEGAYTSGDLDLCHTVGGSIPPRLRHEIMGLLGGTGGPRNWHVAGMYVDLLGCAESFARTKRRVLDAPYPEYFTPELILSGGAGFWKKTVRVFARKRDATSTKGDHGSGRRIRDRRETFVPTPLPSRKGFNSAPWVSVNSGAG